MESESCDPDYRPLAMALDAGRGRSMTEQRFHAISPFASRLVGLARSRGAGQHDAEDLASETMLRLVESRTFDSESEERWSYAARTLVNLVVDRARRSAVESGALSRGYDLAGHAQQPVVEELVMTRVVAAQALRRLVATESPATVHLVILHAMNDMTWEEIGDWCGMTASAARKRVTRALEKLRSWLV